MKPEAMKPEVLPVVRRQTTLAVILLFIAVAAFAGACAWFQKAGAIAEDVIVNCAAPAIESEVADLLDEVKSIIKGGNADWPKELDNLISNSVWAGYCAVQVVLNDLTPPVVSTAPMASGPAPVAVARAQAYLAAHHVTVEHAGTVEHYRKIRAAKHAGLVDPIPLEDTARARELTRIRWADGMGERWAETWGTPSVQP